MKKLLALLAVFALTTQVGFAEKKNEASTVPGQGKGVFARVCKNRAHENDPDGRPELKEENGRMVCPRRNTMHPNSKISSRGAESAESEADAD